MTSQIGAYLTRPVTAIYFLLVDQGPGTKVFKVSKLKQPELCLHV